MLGSLQYELAKKIKNTKKELKIWNKTEIRNCDMQIQELLEEMDEIQRKEPNVANRRIKHEL